MSPRYSYRRYGPGGLSHVVLRFPTPRDCVLPSSSRIPIQFISRNLFNVVKSSLDAQFHAQRNFIKIGHDHNDRLTGKNGSTVTCQTNHLGSFTIPIRTLALFWLPAPDIVEVRIHMQLGIDQILLDPGNDDLGFIRGVLEYPCEQCHGEWLHGVYELGTIIHAEFFISLPLCPRANGHLVYFFVEVDKAGVLHLLPEATGGLQFFAEFLAGLIHLLNPVQKINCFFCSTVVAIHMTVVLLHFHPPAWLEIGKGLRKQSRPIRDTPT